MSVHLRNLAAHLLHIKRLGLFIEPHATVEVSDEDAAKVAGHPLLEATPAKKAPAKSAATKAPVSAPATKAPVATSPAAEPAGFMGGTTPIQKDGE